MAKNKHFDMCICGSRSFFGWIRYKFYKQRKCKKCGYIQERSL